MLTRGQQAVASAAQLAVGGALETKEALRILEDSLASLADRFGSKQRNAVHLERASLELRRGRLNGVLRHLVVMVNSGCDEIQTLGRSASEKAVELYAAPLSVERSTVRRLV